MKYCPTCGNAVDDAVKFCFRCGHAFPVAPVYPADAPEEAQPAPEWASDPAPDPDAASPVAQTPSDPAALATPLPDAPSDEADAPKTQEPSPFGMETPVPAFVPAPAPEPAPAMPVPQKPRRELLSTIQYILLIILFSIPVVGLICLFVFGCGDPKNPSLKRFSLAVLILTLVVWILLIAAAIVGYVRYADSLPTFLRAFQQWFAALDLSSVLGV